jgi:hypothetical protein
MNHRTVLARKGPLRRAEAARPCALRAVLSGWFRDGRLRRDELRSFISTTENPNAKTPRIRLHGFPHTAALAIIAALAILLGKTLPSNFWQFFKP